MNRNLTHWMLTGRRFDDVVDFGGRLPDEVQVSIRPQAIQLLRERPGERDARCCVQARIQRRSYLGESWDYHVNLGPALETVRVSARPGDVFEVGQTIYAEIDTSQITLVSD